MDTRREEGVPMRKGPWMAEEDEILINYVNKHGPRDWSSIRAKGLLPRTGKSCRLRWVNKLKPDLKTGCKFSAEEERIVIDLQAQFGNKWARIATYLPGRTDNDVKNFWSTRQKRLARTMQMPKPHKSHEKLPVFQEASDFKVPRTSTMAFSPELTTGGESSNPSSTHNSEAMSMVDLPDLISPNPLNIGTDHPPLEMIPMDQNPYLEQQPLQPPLPQLEFPFPQLPEPSLGIPLPPGGQEGDLCQGFVDPVFSDMFGCCHGPPSENDLGFSSGFPALELDTGQNGVKLEAKINPSTPESFFDDFPTDMFDYLESLPSSSDW
ncbi:hypothetical protein H6P81_017324 [Aristolochia fimbriata]|uniref:Uncharacterized protein n=1 Tax=Aristolochia fimbriata TaxID=158543 RepID=A0AAV7DXU6_ARIFI|nr:hypothetical protein H6P81_017324 [Aristolochia fimbriata]